MIRATTGGVMRTYRANLMRSFIAQNKARDTVLTQRNFNSYAEDPAAAAKAFQLRRSRMSVESQYDICDDAYRKFQSAYSSLDTVDKLIDTENGTEMNTLKRTTLKMLNDPTGDARVQLNKALDQISQTIVQAMNQKYGDNFIFAGADGQNVPFTIENDTLYYRGVRVDAAVPNVVEDASGAPLKINPATNQIAAGGEYLMANSVSVIANDNPSDPPPANVLLKADGTPQMVDASGKLDDAGGYYLSLENAKTMTEADYDAEVKEAEKLDYLAKQEKYFVDIGLGFQEGANGKLIESSGFNAALSGLTFLGYGVDADGDPKNIYSIVQKLKNLAARVDDGQWSDNDGEEFNHLVGKLLDASSKFKTEYTNMDAGTTKLKNNLQLLEDNFYNLQEQYSDLEDADMVESITNFVWAQYCYNAALKVGNNILSESLMDYLN